MSPIGLAVVGLVGLAALGVGIVWRLCRRTLVVVLVSGRSMWPTYGPGDAVLVRRARAQAARIGDVVVFAREGLTRRDSRPWPPSTTTEHGGEWMIKRVAATAGDPAPEELRRSANETVPPGCIAVLGDNRSSSHDSRHFGYVNDDGFLGIGAFRLFPGRDARSRPATVTGGYKLGKVVRKLGKVVRRCSPGRLIRHIRKRQR